MDSFKLEKKEEIWVIASTNAAFQIMENKNKTKTLPIKNILTFNSFNSFFLGSPAIFKGKTIPSKSYSPMKFGVFPVFGKF